MKKVLFLIFALASMCLKSQSISSTSPQTGAVLCKQAIDTIITISNATTSLVTINNIVPGIKANVADSVGTVISQINVSQDTTTIVGNYLYILLTDYSGANAKLQSEIYLTNRNTGSPFSSNSPNNYSGSTSTGTVPWTMTLVNGQIIQFAASGMPPGGHWFVEIKGCKL